MRNRTTRPGRAALKWVRRIAAGIAGVLLIAVAITAFRFELWERKIERNLASDSVLTQTPRGPIEYAEIGRGPAVLVLHGTPGGYDDPLGALKLTHAEKDGFRYVIPSRPGYLRTPLSVGVTPAEQADAAASLLDALHIERAAVIGQSGGGPSALQFALRHSDRCSALVLESALVRNYAGPAPQVPRSAFAGYLRDLAIFVFKDVGIAPYQAANPADPLITSLAQAAVRAVVPFRLRKVGVENDLVQQTHLDGWPLNRIQCPTLILQGSADQSAPPADAEFAHQQIPNSELVELPGEDHMMMITKHAELASRIHAFLTAHQP